jgi:phosphatidylserine decarboxylase
MPKDSKHTQKWLKDLMHKVKSRPRAEWSPSILAFQRLIEGDSQVYMFFHMMFEQIPLKQPYLDDPTGNRQIRNYMEMLDCFNYLLTQGPLWIYNTEGQMGLIGFPFNAVLVCDSP